MWQYNYSNSNELYHHGILGQKWGVRRYQNEDGSLTPAGVKRYNKGIESDRKSEIKKGTKLYRVSENSGSDAANDKIYVSATEKSSDFYTKTFGANKARKAAEAYIHEYVAINDIKIPDKKTMEKIELGLLKDKNIRTELVDSLMKKGMTREAAEDQVKAYNAGKSALQKVGQISYGALVGGTTAMYPGFMAYAMSHNPVAFAGTVGVGAVAGAVAGAKTTTEERDRALKFVRMSYGDKDNKVLNETLRDKLAEKGYNAIKDYNDRRAFGKDGKGAVIVFDSDKNIKMEKSTKMTPEEYGKAYAREYLREHPKSESSFESLVKEGSSKYEKYFEEGIVNKQLREDADKKRKDALERAKRKP